jgi:hypothetical protein
VSVVQASTDNVVGVRACACAPPSMLLFRSLRHRVQICGRGVRSRMTLVHWGASVVQMSTGSIVGVRTIACASPLPL